MKIQLKTPKTLSNQLSTSFRSELRCSVPKICPCQNTVQNQSSLNISQALFTHRFYLNKLHKKKSLKKKRVISSMLQNSIQSVSYEELMLNKNYEKPDLINEIIEDQSDSNIDSLRLQSNNKNNAALSYPKQYSNNNQSTYSINQYTNLKQSTNNLNGIRPQQYDKNFKQNYEIYGNLKIFKKTQDISFNTSQMYLQKFPTIFRQMSNPQILQYQLQQNPRLTQQYRTSVQPQQSLVERINSVEIIQTNSKGMFCEEAQKYSGQNMSSIYELISKNNKLESIKEIESSDSEKEEENCVYQKFKPQSVKLNKVCLNEIKRRSENWNTLSQKLVKSKSIILNNINTQTKIKCEQQQNQTSRNQSCSFTISEKQSLKDTNIFRQYSKKKTFQEQATNEANIQLRKNVSEDGKSLNGDFILDHLIVRKVQSVNTSKNNQQQAFSQISQTFHTNNLNHGEKAVGLFSLRNLQRRYSKIQQEKIKQLNII